MAIENIENAVELNFDTGSREEQERPLETEMRRIALPPAFQTRYIDLVGASVVPHLKDFFKELQNTGASFFLLDQIERSAIEFVDNHPALDSRQGAAIRRLFRGCQEILLFGGYVYAALRPKIGRRIYVRLHPDEERMEEVSREHYLEMKDAYVQSPEEAARDGLRLDFSRFFRGYPKVKRPEAMGEGMSLLNRHLSGQMYQNPAVFQRALLEFLHQCKLDGENILLNDCLTSPEKLFAELENALAMLSDLAPHTPLSEFSGDLRRLGFDPGWGCDARTCHANLHMLAEVFESSDAKRFELFLGQLPLTQNILMVSPHGWFAQHDVLGKPDTGGQVTYVLDQARAIERRLRESFDSRGLHVAPKVIILTRLIPDAEGTTCDQPRERVIGTENCWILRVPFRYPGGEVHPHWISRFAIWPYIERFAAEAAEAVLREFMGRPDLVVGHYSDGNLAAYLIAERLRVTHCACVHALEKTKYLFSDMCWSDMESEYHFSLQFTADILSYNSADYIITSSYREIGGTDVEMGMFESYETFSMPGLYRVVSGMDPQLARYNIVAPGASKDYFFPNTETPRRTPSITAGLAKALLDTQPGPGAVGRLDHPDRAPVFAMSRVDKVKNLSGLIDLFGKSESLRQSANLIIVSSLTDAAQSEDQEEIEQIHKMYSLIEQHRLEGHFRWAGMRLGKAETGEVYRMMADRRGVFAQPALMETFGLTVVESMACGLPVVVTCFGGPGEIVIPGASGEVVNPNDHEAFAEALLRVVTDVDLWNRYAAGGIARVREAFNWNAHASKVLGLANVYTYWNYLDVMNRGALDQYIHTLFHTLYRPRAERM